LQILTTLLSVTVSVALAEVALRIMPLRPAATISKRGLRSDAVGSFLCYSTNPNGELSPAPDVTSGKWVYADFTFESNPLPLSWISETPWCVRNDKQLYDLRPADGVTRILVVGDSFTAGEGVPPSLSFPAQLGRLLGPRYEVINEGHAGEGTTDEVLRLPTLCEQTGSKRAFLVFIANDIGLTAALRQRQQFINDLVNVRDRYLDEYERDRWYHGRSRLLARLGALWDMRRIEAETIRWYLDSYDSRYNAESLNQLEDQFRALAGRPGGCEVALILYPLMERLGSEYPLAAVHERVADLAKRAGLRVLDLRSAFGGQRTRSLQVHPTDHHPNGKAHAIAARAIADWLSGPGRMFLEETAAR
jgi:lysophospholipase L1-like esterase